MARKRRSENGETDRPKQAFIPGTEPPSIKAIDNAAEEYVGARDNRMSILRTEIQLHGVLLELMKEHGLLSYEYDSKVIVVSNLEKVKVTRKGAHDDE